MLGLPADTLIIILFRVQYIFMELEKQAAYNTFTNSDLGSLMTGYYLEGGYNFTQIKILMMVNSIWIRYENYNTHDEMAEGFESKYWI